MSCCVTAIFFLFTLAPACHEMCYLSYINQYKALILKIFFISVPTQKCVLYYVSECVIDNILILLILTICLIKHGYMEVSKQRIMIT